jgi:5-carboxymethyl-2-hydroxymuconate isomerase
MPHLTLQYSSNLAASTDVDGLCRAIHRAMMSTGLFELGAVRVRAIEARHYAIGDCLSENSFVDIILRMGTGRSIEDQKRAGKAIFEAAVEFLSERFASPHFAFSLEIQEINSSLSWKKNAMHERLRKVTTGE